jgi:hypothetical protein
MYILNFKELFDEGKLNKDNYIICTKEQALDLLKYKFMPLGECEDNFVFTKNELIELLLQGGDNICYRS